MEKVRGTQTYGERGGAHCGELTGGGSGVLRRRSQDRLAGRRASVVLNFPRRPAATFLLLFLPSLRFSVLALFLRASLAAASTADRCVCDYTRRRPHHDHGEHARSRRPEGPHASGRDGLRTHPVLFRYPERPAGGPPHPRRRRALRIRTAEVLQRTVRIRSFPPLYRYNPSNRHIRSRITVVCAEVSLRPVHILSAPLHALPPVPCVAQALWVRSTCCAPPALPVTLSNAHSRWTYRPVPVQCCSLLVVQADCFEHARDCELGCHRCTFQVCPKGAWYAAILLPVRTARHGTVSVMGTVPSFWCLCTVNHSSERVPHRCARHSIKNAGCMVNPYRSCLAPSVARGTRWLSVVCVDGNSLLPKTQLGHGLICVLTCQLQCKRLKLKCDRRTPCSSCLKRDTVQRCVYSQAAAEKV